MKTFFAANRISLSLHFAGFIGLALPAVPSQAAAPSPAETVGRCPARGRTRSARRCRTATTPRPSRPSTRRPAKDAPRDYLAYLKGRACTSTANTTRRSPSSTSREASSPRARGLAASRFAKAVALARKGDFRAAELIYRAEAEYLLSADRKQQIADIYLEFADTLFQAAQGRRRSPTTPRRWSSTRRRWRWDRRPRSGSRSSCWWPSASRSWASSARRPRAMRSSSRTIRRARWTSRPASAWAMPLGRGQPAARPGGSGRTCWRSMSTNRSRPAMADAQFDLWPAPGTSPSRRTTRS